MSVNHSARSGGIIGISLEFLYIKVYCLFSLESPHPGDSNQYTQYTIFQYEKENHSKLSQFCNFGIFSKGLKYELERVGQKCFKWHFSSSRATTVPNCFEIHA